MTCKYEIMLSKCIFKLKIRIKLLYLIPAFQVTFKDQSLEIFGQNYLNIRIIFGFQNYHKLNTNINICWKLFEYSNIFKYSLEH